MSNSTTPTPSRMNSSSKKRKYDQVDQPPPPPPPTGSVLYITLYALPPPERHGGVLDYRWAFLLAPDDKPETRGRQYLIRETSPRLDPREGAAGSSTGFGIVDPEQQRRRFDSLLATRPFESKEVAQTSSEWKIEIQDISIQSSGEARVKVQLPRVQDVDIFEALIKDAFLESDGNRGPDWNPVMWMRDAWSSLVENGDVLGVAVYNLEPAGWEMVQKAAMDYIELEENKGRAEGKSVTIQVPTC